MISRKEVLMGREQEYPLTPELEQNLVKLLECLNKFRAKYGKPMTVTSGYRPGKYNKQAGGAGNSAHLICQAADFQDKDGSLAKYCLANVPLLVECGLYMENPVKTVGWIHLQTRPTRHRVFNP